MMTSIARPLGEVLRTPVNFWLYETGFRVQEANRRLCRVLVRQQAQRHPQCLFVPINKTCTTSVCRALGDIHLHTTAQDMEEAVGQDAYRKAFTFAVVRNPWDKMYSMYKYRTFKHTQLSGIMCHFNPFIRMTLPEWIKKRDEYYQDYNTFAFSGACQVSRADANQLAWLTDAQGEVMVDFLARFESLDRDWQILQQEVEQRRLQLPQLMHLNRVQPGNPPTRGPQQQEYRAAYDDESVEIVAKYFKRDIEYFGFDF